MNIKHLKEPLLEFGGEFLCDEPKMGISVGGFFSHTNNTHKSQIHFGIIGTNNDIELVKQWVKRLDSTIEANIKSETKNFLQLANITIEDGVIAEEDEDDFSEELKSDHLLFGQSEEFVTIEEEHLIQNKKLNPDFPGFNEESIFKSSFVNDESNNKVIKENKIKDLLKEKAYDDFTKAIHICDLYIERYKEILDTPILKPSICIIVIPEIVYKKLSSIRLSSGIYFNLRRHLKAQLITLQDAIPVQLILEETLLGTKKSLQDLSMQAWNFSVANYYKNNCTPWTLTLKDKETCFIGVSFNKVLDLENNLMRSSVAQAFNYEGKGLIFVGKQFQWDSKKMGTNAPHLSYSYAKSLVEEVLKLYKKYHRGLSPARVVIHKTTDFWNAMQNPEYAEVEGLKDGIREILGEEVEVDLVTIKGASIKLLRSNGKFPVLRGTLLEINRAMGILYTTGYIPYFETFPGVHIPHPIEVNIYEGESTLKKVCEEILALTKMNFNNCNYYDSIPITIRFAKKVGEIVEYAPDGVALPSQYFYYM